VGTVPSTRRPASTYSAICRAAAGVAQARQLGGQLARAPRALAQPEGNRGRLALGIGHAHDAGLHAQDPPGGVAELEDVAAVGLDGPVLIDGAHQRPFGLQAHLVVRGVRDGPAREEREQAGPARGPQAAVDAVAVEQRAPPFGMKADHLVELLPRQVAIGPGPPNGLEQRALVPGLGHAGGHHLLREDVERARRRGSAVEEAQMDAAQEGGRLHQVVQGQGEDAALGHAAQGVARAAHPLQERGDGAGGADLDHEVHVADVDAQLQRRGRHQGPERARLQPLLGVEPALAGEAAVMAGDRVFAQELRELGRDPLGHLARVDEDERRAMAPHQLRHLLVDLLPLFMGADGGERRGRDLDPHVQLAERARVHQAALAARADQEPADLVQRLLRGGERHALDRPARQGLQPLEGKGQMAAPLVAHEGVDLVDDGGADGGQHAPARVAGEHEVERLGCGHQDVGWAARHGRALAGGRIARADEDADLGE
jgi:hypothetical protein